MSGNISEMYIKNTRYNFIPGRGTIQRGRFITYKSTPNEPQVHFGPVLLCLHCWNLPKSETLTWSYVGEVGSAGTKRRFSGVRSR
jgi:hypothetical protein